MTNCLLDKLIYYFASFERMSNKFLRNSKIQFLARLKFLTWDHTLFISIPKIECFSFSKIWWYCRFINAEQVYAPGYLNHGGSWKKIEYSMGAKTQFSKTQLYLMLKGSQHLRAPRRLRITLTFLIFTFSCMFKW